MTTALSIEKIFTRPQVKVMFSQASVTLFTISLTAARSLLILVAYLVSAHLCYLAVNTHPTGMLSCYRPQRSWSKVIFSEVCVYNSVHRGGGMHGCSGGMCGCSGGCAWLLLGGVHGIRRDTEIRSMSGRYASYCNAFLFINCFSKVM